MCLISLRIPEVHEFAKPLKPLLFTCSCIWSLLIPIDQGSRLVFVRALLFPFPYCTIHQNHFGKDISCRLPYIIAI